MLLEYFVWNAEGFGEAKLVMPPDFHLPTKEGRMLHLYRERCVKEFMHWGGAGWYGSRQETDGTHWYRVFGDKSHPWAANSAARASGCADPLWFDEIPANFKPEVSNEPLSGM